MAETMEEKRVAGADARPADAATQPEHVDDQDTSTLAQDMNELDVNTQSADPSYLREELARVQEERDAFESQYNNLLEKLAHMRTTVGERLRQDAEELDRREQQIERLTSQVGDYESASVTLKDELVASNAENERMTEELDKLRGEMSKSVTLNDPADFDRLEARCRELQETVDGQRVDLDRWESALMEERSWKEGLEAQVQRTESALQHAREREMELQSTVEQEKRVARQLQQALEEFQLERDVQRTVGEMQNQVDKAESELETYKLRLHDTEAQLNAAQEATSKCEALEREVKEKNLFIGKLRHEAVILNEHLTESLRQIRRESSEALVDRRLVTNLVLQFLSFPRADTKRFEVLKLMASVLQWDDEQREKAGLQRNQDRGGGYRLFGFGSSQKAPQSPAPSGGAGDEAAVTKRDGKDVNAEVYLIRHGEKIDDDHTGLSPRGEERADCVADLFSQGDLKVDAIITQDYKSNGKRIRPYDTVKGLADRLGLTIDHHCDRDDQDCAAKTISKAADNGAQKILVCWEHDALSDIANAIGVKGLDYPSERFDLVWEIDNGKLTKQFSEECPNLDN